MKKQVNPPTTEERQLCAHAADDTLYRAPQSKNKDHREISNKPVTTRKRPVFLAYFSCNLFYVKGYGQCFVFSLLLFASHLIPHSRRPIQFCIAFCFFIAIE